MVSLLSNEVETPVSTLCDKFVAGFYMSVDMMWANFVRPLFFLEVLPINEWKINEEIRDKELRVIAEDGEQLGVLPLNEALTMSIDKDLDLVLISPSAKPPVAKLMDYGKYRFEAIKKEKDAKKKQKVIKIKEVRLSPVIDAHDLNVRAKNAIKFLGEGDKVKASIRFKGRQMSYSDKGREVMKVFYSMIEDYAIMEKNPIMEGRNMFMILVPKAPDKSKAAEVKKPVDVKEESEN